MTLAAEAADVALGPGESPQWIWGEAIRDTKAPGGRCDFRTQLQLQSPRRGLLEIACDDHYLLRFNGRLIGMGDDWQQWDAYDVTPLLRDGENQLLIICRNDGGHAGLAVRLTVDEATEAGGATKTRRWGSNPRWEAKLQAAGTWDPTIDRRTPWLPATSLGPIDGTPLWGDKIASASEVRLVRSEDTHSMGPLQLQSGDKVVFLGSTWIERAQRYGHWDAIWTAAFPDRQILLRNLGWSGDTVFGHARARFGTIADGFDHLETHVFAERPAVVVVGYGTNESFEGDEGLDSFVEGLKRLIDTLEATGARVILLSPPPMENLGPPLPDVGAANQRLGSYSKAIAKVAQERNCTFVDVFQRFPDWLQRYPDHQPYTDNSLHLNAHGYWLVSQLIADELELLHGHARIEIDTAAHLMTSVGCHAEKLQQQGDAWRFSVRDQALAIPSPLRAGPGLRQLRVAGLKAGTYRLTIDGVDVATNSADEWGRGVMLRAGPEAQQAAQLLDIVRRRDELYFHRWRPENETYLFLFRKHEQGNNAVEIPQFDPLIEDMEQQIAMLRAPRMHDYQLQRDTPTKDR